MKPFASFSASLLVLALLGATPRSLSAAPPSVPQASFSEGLTAFQAGVLFLDARPPEDYAYGHIPGALNLPIWEKDFESRLAAFRASPQADRRRPVIVYCNGCCSTDSLFLAQRLRDLGFTGVRAFRDGFRAWARAGRPMATGALPGSLGAK